MTAGTTAELSYALVTPARNEEKFIEGTLRSVVGQTKPPIRWVIVSDGSTDDTDEIVLKYARLHPWIELIHLPDQKERNFAAKARAFNIGYQSLSDVPYDVIGNLDADLTFDEEYFAFLLRKFVEIPDLGVAGTPFVEGAAHYDYRFTNIEHVSGACQLFRRRCFQDVGGYVPVKGGGIDWIAVTTARMKGWRTRTFVEKVCLHHRKMGSSRGRLWKAWFRRGVEDYAMGGHPLWQMVRTAYQMKSPPVVVGGFFLLCGYAYGLARRVERPVSEELVRFHRKEQMFRLKAVASRFLPFGRNQERHLQT
jgi:biofilm PGA synthesis N-glycosyltransferase PgaC